MPVLQLIRKRFVKEKPLKGIRWRPACTSPPRPPTSPSPCATAAPTWLLCALQPALDAGRRRRRARRRSIGIPTFAIKGEDNETYYKHINAALDHKPQITMDDGADLVSALHTKRTDLIADVIGGTEETTTGVIRLRAMAKDGALKYPDHRRQRRDHQAPLRQSLRHRPVHAGRHHPRHQPPAGRQRRRRRRLRLVRTRRRHARQRPGRARHRHRNRSAQGPRSGHGRLPRHAHERSRQDRRHLRHRHRRQVTCSRASISSA